VLTRRRAQGKLKNLEFGSPASRSPARSASAIPAWATPAGRPRTTPIPTPPNGLPSCTRHHREFQRASGANWKPRRKIRHRDGYHSLSCAVSSPGVGELREMVMPFDISCGELVLRPWLPHRGAGAREMLFSRGRGTTQAVAGRGIGRGLGPAALGPSVEPSGRAVPRAARVEAAKCQMRSFRGTPPRPQARRGASGRITRAKSEPREQAWKPGDQGRRAGLACRMEAEKAAHVGEALLHPSASGASPRTGNRESAAILHGQKAKKSCADGTECRRRRGNARPADAGSAAKELSGGPATAAPARKRPRAQLP